MKPPRSALPLPRYTLRKPLKGGGWGHFFNVPMWARKAGCPFQNEALGKDYEVAVSRAETILLPAFDAWRTGGASDAPAASVAAAGTLDWLFAEYRSDRRYTKLDGKTKRNHENGFKLVGGHVLKDGRRLGQARITAITTAVTDAHNGVKFHSGEIPRELRNADTVAVGIAPLDSKVHPFNIAPLNQASHQGLIDVGA